VLRFGTLAEKMVGFASRQNNFLHGWPGSRQRDKPRPPAPNADSAECREFRTPIRDEPWIDGLAKKKVALPGPTLSGREREETTAAGQESAKALDLPRRPKKLGLVDLLRTRRTIDYGMTRCGCSSCLFIRSEATTQRFSRRQSWTGMESQSALVGPGDMESKIFSAG